MWGSMFGHFALRQLFNLSTLQNTWWELDHALLSVTNYWYTYYLRHIAKYK